MQIKPLILTIAVLGGLAYLADHWMLDQPAAPLMKQNIVALPLASGVADSLDEHVSASFIADDKLLIQSDLGSGIQDLVRVAQIKKRLFKAKLLRSGGIKVSALNGELVIEGQVIDEATKQQIISLAKRTVGVQDVVDKIDIR